MNADSTHERAARAEHEPALSDHMPERKPERKPKQNTGRWVFAVIGVLVVGGLIWLLRARSRDAAAGAVAAGAGADRVIPVVTAQVAQKDVPIYLEGLGNVTPLQTVAVKSQVDGRLDRVLFKEGQAVKRGDVIAQIDPRPFVIQLHTAEAAQARDKAQLRNATLNLDRFKTLRQQNLIPQQQVDDQQTLADQQAAVVQGDVALIETARLNLDYARVVSPIDGVTGVRLIDPGNLVHANDATGMVVITQLDPIAVLFTLPEDDLPRIQKQLAAGAIAIDAFSREGSTLLGRGQLALIDNQINTTTATIRLKATFANADRVLWPNEFVKARVLLSTRKGALVIPAAAVQRGPQGTFVYVTNPDNTVALRTIEIESTQGESVLIANGLAVGETIVSDGQSQLRPGAKIAPRKAERPAPVGGSTSPTGSGAPAGSARGGTLP